MTYTGEGMQSGSDALPKIVRSGVPSAAAAERAREAGAGGLKAKQEAEMNSWLNEQKLLTHEIQVAHEKLVAGAKFKKGLDNEALKKVAAEAEAKAEAHLRELVEKKATLDAKIEARRISLN